MGRTAWWSRSGGRCVRLLLPAVNSMLLFSCIVAVPTFYLASRLWRILQLTSWVFAVVYVLRPFLYSTKLRYAYSRNEKRKDADWPLNVQKLPAIEMVAPPGYYGFSGVLFNRKIHADRDEQRLAEFSKASWAMEFEQGVGSEWAFIELSTDPNFVFSTLTPCKITAILQDCKRLVFADTNKISI